MTAEITAIRGVRRELLRAGFGLDHLTIILEEADHKRLRSAVARAAGLKDAEVVGPVRFLGIDFQSNQPQSRGVV
jgi:hypothetical protein